MTNSRRLAPHPDFLHLYKERETKLINFPDHVVRMVNLNQYEWATLNWMLDGEQLRLQEDILQTVLDWSHHYIGHFNPESFICDAFSQLLDHYLFERVQDWGVETMTMVATDYSVVNKAQ